jgi:hypothetical protein
LEGFAAPAAPVLAWIGAILPRQTPPVEVPEGWPNAPRLTKISSLSTAGAAMRLVIGLFVLTMLSTMTAGIGLAVFDGRIGHHEPAMRAIHYDTQFDLGAQRRLPIE